MPYQHLLVAVDFSDSSRRALLRALAIARALQADLSVVHVLELAVNPILEDTAVIGLPGVWEQDLNHSLLAETETKFLAWQREVFSESPFEVACKCYLEAGPVVPTLLHLIELHEVDCLVLGFQSHSALHALFGGSGPALWAQTPCDVLRVK
ncbi:MAG: universal stress protein [Thiotrichales bacterium]|nr:universal stress protein [Thiotrichales bacterium]